MLSIEVDPKSLARINRALASLKSVDDDSPRKKGIINASNYVLAVLQGYVSGAILHVRSGNLLRSMGLRVEGIGDDVVGTVGSGAKVDNPQIAEEGADVHVDDTFRMVYANILETGGTIVPTKCQFLAIPLPGSGAMTDSGVARFSAQQLKDGQAPGYEGSVIIDGIIFGTKDMKSRSQIEPLFALKRSVDIPAFGYMQKTIDDTTPTVVEMLGIAIDEGLNQ